MEIKTKIQEILNSQNVNCILQVGNKTGKDVDLFVFYEDDGEFLREVIKIDEVNFDISYVPLNILKQGFIEKWDFLFNALKNYQIIYQKNNKIFPLIEKIKTEKRDKLSNEEIEYYRFYFYEQLCDLYNKKGSEDCLFLSFCILKDIVIFYFKTKQIFIPKNKKLLKTLININDHLGKLCYDFILENNIDKKIKLLKHIVDEVLKPYGGILKVWQKGRFPLK